MLYTCTAYAADIYKTSWLGLQDVLETRKGGGGGGGGGWGGGGWRPAASGARCELRALCYVHKLSNPAAAL